MKNIKLIFILALAFLLVLPFSVRAEGEEATTEETTTEETTTAKASNKEVNLYFFRGEGCSHCAEFKEWLAEIEGEYGSMFEVKDYETWNDEDNAALMEEVAELRDEEASGVPYIIIGEKSWQGFADDYKEEILNQIKSEYDKDPADRYDIMKYLDKDDEDNSASDVVALFVILLVSALIIFGIVKARKSAK